MKLVWCSLLFLRFRNRLLVLFRLWLLLVVRCVLIGNVLVFIFSVWFCGGRL